MKIEVFLHRFRERLSNDRFPITEIEAECTGGTIRHAFDTAHQWLDKHYPRRFLHSNLYNHQRDSVLPRIMMGIDDILAPWKKTNCTEYLPVITLKELSRQIGMHQRHIFNILRKWNPEFNIGEQIFCVSMTEVNPLHLSKCNRKRWQRECAEQDAELLNIKLALVAKQTF